MNKESHNGLLFPARPSLGYNLLYIAFIAIAYFAVARLSLLLVFQPEGIAAIWPPAGIFLSAILLSRKTIRPYLVCALFIADLIAELMAGIPFLVSVVYSLALSCDAVFGSWLLLHFIGEPISFKKMRDVAGFLIFALILSNGLTSLLPAWASTSMPGISFWNSFKLWTASDGIGNLIITPLILSWASSAKIKFETWKPKRVIEGAALFIPMALVNYAAFSQLPGHAQFSLLLSYLTFPFLLWAALRFGVRGVTSALLIIAAITISSAAANETAGISIYGSRLDEVIIVQLYLAVMAIPSLFLAAAVEERKQSYEALAESEEKFKYVFEYSAVGKSITLISGEIHVNNAFCGMLGYSSKELQNRKWQEISHPDDIDLTQREIDSFLSGEKNRARFIKRLLHKNGSVVWVDLSTSLRRDKEGRPLYLITALIDITEQKRIEEETNRRNRELAILNTIAIAVSQSLDLTKILHVALEETLSMLDSDAGLVYLCDNVNKIFVPVVHNGISAEVLAELSGFKSGQGLSGHAAESGKVLVIADLSADPNNISPTAVREGWHGYAGVPIKSIDQVVGVMTLASHQPGHFTPDHIGVLDHIGNQIGVAVEKAKLYASVQQELSERKRTEKALRESEARLKLAQDAAHAGVWEWDLKTNENYWSQELWGLYGLEQNSCKPSYNAWKETIHPDDKKKTELAVQEASRNMRELNAEWRVKAANGKDDRERWLMSRGQPVFDDSGQAVKYIGIVIDITERKTYERQLEEKNAELERFNYTVSHDLRSPLVTLKAFLGYLEKDIAQQDIAKIETDIKHMQRASGKMAQLLDELLEFSRVSRVVNPPARVMFRDLVDEALSIVAGRITERGVDVRVYDHPVALYGDRSRLTEIWQNLIENAAKFMGEQPSPVIEIGAEARGGDTVFFIRDNGIGIDQKYHEKVFGLFEKLDPRIEGTGLGLALVKRIVDMYRGTIRLQSRGAGTGLCVRFTLPLANAGKKKGERQ